MYHALYSGCSNKLCHYSMSDTSHAAFLAALAGERFGMKTESTGASESKHIKYIFEINRKSLKHGR